jgi:hypothetical protein
VKPRSTDAPRVLPAAATAALDAWLGELEGTYNAPSLLRGTGVKGLVLVPYHAGLIFYRKTKEIGFVPSVRLAATVVPARLGIRR